MIVCLVKASALIEKHSEKQPEGPLRGALSSSSGRSFRGLSLRPAQGAARPISPLPEMDSAVVMRVMGELQPPLCGLWSSWGLGLLTVGEAGPLSQSCKCFPQGLF